MADVDCKKYSINVEKIRSNIATSYLNNLNKNPHTNYGWQNLHPAWNIRSLDLTPKIYYNNDRKKCRSKKHKHDKTTNIKEIKFPRLATSSKTYNNDNDKMAIEFRVVRENCTKGDPLLVDAYHDKQAYRQPRPHHFKDDIHRPVSQLCI